MQIRHFITTLQIFWMRTLRVMPLKIGEAIRSVGFAIRPL